jgi:hypothetical protein
MLTGGNHLKSAGVIKILKKPWAKLANIDLRILYMSQKIMIFNNRE